MAKVIGNIYEERDYSKFRRLGSNRDVLSGRLNKLMASISEKYILNPIVINEYYEVIDGQGRFEACKALGKPIHYIIAKGATIEDCRRMNKYNSKWALTDFVDSYSKALNINYMVLKNTCEDTKMNLSRVLRLANRGGSERGGSTKMSIIESGKLIFTAEDAKTVKMAVKAANEIREALQFTLRPNDAFYTSVKIAVETDGYDHDRMLKNCKACRSTYNQMSNLGAQLKEFERIYNYRSKAGRLYFSDYMRNKGYNTRDYDNSSNQDADISTLI